MNTPNRMKPPRRPRSAPGADLTLPRLLVLTDRSQLRLGRGLLATLAECVEAGLTHVVLRELDEPAEQRARLASAATDLGLVVIAAHGPLAGAAGVQAPAAGGDTVSARVAAGHHPLPPDVTPCYPQGRSCHSSAEVARAAEDGCDYAMLSPYALTESKPGYGPPLGPVAFGGLSLPTYALGGITPDNAAEAVEAGAHGVAVMGAVMRAEEPGHVVRDLLAVLATAEVAP